MLKKVLLVLVALIAVFAVVVALQPSEFHVERTVMIDAPASKVFGEVNDFHKWDAWSPWAKLDPNAKDKTAVTWSMNDDHSFMEKAICLIMNGKKMVGDQMEKGLAQLKQVSESQS